MRTLKKTLCLVLALVMMLGLCCVGTSAAFDDQDEITYAEEVDVMTGLGIINGMGDGTFAPKGTLTRAQAAVMLTKMLGDSNVATAAVSTFADVPASHWAAKYVAYCSANKYVSGYGDGNFGPDAELTGYAWALMCIRALGYNAAAEGIGGSTWELGVAKLVKTLDLAKGIEGFDGTAPITREEAAKIGYNALFVVMQKWVEGTSINGGDISINVGGAYDTAYANAKHTLFKDVFKGNQVNGIVVTNGENVAGQKYTEVSALNNEGIADGTIFKLNIESTGLFGHYVTVAYKDTWASAQKPGTAYSIEDKTVTVSCAPTDKAPAVKTAFSDANYAVTGTATFDKLYQNGAIANTAKVVTFGTTAGSDIKGITFYGYYDAANKVTVAYGYAMADAEIVTYVSGISAVVGKETITFANGGLVQNNATTDKVNEYEGIAKNDVVTYTKDGDVFNVSATTKVTGKASAKVTTTGKQSVTVDGTAYSIAPSFTSAAGAIGSDITLVALADVALGKDCTLYLNAAGKVVAIASVAAAANYVYVVKGFSKSEATDYGAKTTYYAQCVNLEGEEVQYQVETALGTGYDKQLCKVVVEYKESVKADCATFTVANDDTTTLVAKNVASGGSANIGKTDKKLGTNNYYFDANTLFIYVKGELGQLKVTTASGVKPVDNGTTAYAYYVTKAAGGANGNVKAVFVVDGTAPNATGAGYIFAAGGTSANAVSYEEGGATKTGYMQKVWLDGEEKEIMTSTAAVALGFYTYAEAENGLVTLTKVTDDVYTAQTISNYYNGFLTATSLADIKADEAVVVNCIAPTEAKYDNVSTDLATIAQGKGLDGDALTYTVAIAVNAKVTPNTVTYVYIYG